MLFREYLQQTKGVTRREFEEMMKEGVMSVNGQIVDNFQQTIECWHIFTIDLEEWSYEEKVEKFPHVRKVVALFNKPKGFVVSKKDPHNRTIYELLPESRKKDFYYVGRLDKDSHGLLLLTNYPPLVDYFEHPNHKITKVYHVRITTQRKSAHTNKLRKGINVTDDGQLAEKVEPQERKWVELLRFHDVQYEKDKKWMYLRIVLTEGKKRHIRRALKALGYNVRDLMRVSVGIFNLDTLASGKYNIQKIPSHILKATRWWR